MKEVTGTTVPVPTAMILSAFQHVFSRISAPAAKIKRRGTARKLTVLVQIERRVSLSVLPFSKTHTHTVLSLSRRPGVRVGVIFAMLKTIP